MININVIRKLKNKFLDLSLKKKFIILIAGIATISPIFLIGLLASIYYYIGIESLFNDQVSKAVSDTVNVAKLYLKENNEKIKFELLQIGKAIDKQVKIIDESSELNFILDEQVKSRGISEAIIFTKEAVIAKSSLSFSFMFQKISPKVYKMVDEEKIVLLENPGGDKIRAITKLDRVVGAVHRTWKAEDCTASKRGSISSLERRRVDPHWRRGRRLCKRRYIWDTAVSRSSRRL